MGNGGGPSQLFFFPQFEMCCFRNTSFVHTKHFFVTGTVIGGKSNPTVPPPPPQTGCSEAIRRSPLWCHLFLVVPCEEKCRFFGTTVKDGCFAACFFWVDGRIIFGWKLGVVCFSAHFSFYQKKALTTQHGLPAAPSVCLSPFFIHVAGLKHQQAFLSEALFPPAFFW